MPATAAAAARSPAVQRLRHGDAGMSCAGRQSLLVLDRRTILSPIHARRVAIALGDGSQSPQRPTNQIASRSEVAMVRQITLPVPELKSRRRHARNFRRAPSSARTQPATPPRTESIRYRLAPGSRSWEQPAVYSRLSVGRGSGDLVTMWWWPAYFSASAIKKVNKSLTS